MEVKESECNNVIKIGDTRIPIVKPDHVSLGQCVVHQEFIRKYSSIKDSDILNLLHDGFIYNGFKDLLIESSEQEGFANMHHILLLSSSDNLVTKELCLRRKNNISVDISKLKVGSEIITDIHSAVVILPDKEASLYFYYFGKDKKNLYFQMDYPKDNFIATLISDVLTLDFGSHITVVNYRDSSPVIKNVDVSPDMQVLSTALEYMVSYKKSDECPQLYCANLHSDKVDSVLVSADLLNDLSESKMISVSVGPLYWICADHESVRVFERNEENGLKVQHCTDIQSFYPKADLFTFVDLCYCCTTMQCFLLYLKEVGDDISSFIVVLDVNKLEVTSVLEMEMTLNRTPDLLMYPLRDGSKLFVQEIFENRVIFYQAFTLLPVDHMLQNLNL